MSQDEINTGKLIPTNLSFNELKDMCDKWEYEIKTESDLREAIYELELPYIQFNEKWYKLEDHKCSNDMYGCELYHNEDGSIDFWTLHYNGGAHWSELVGDKLNGN